MWTSVKPVRVCVHVCGASLLVGCQEVQLACKKCYSCGHLLVTKLICDDAKVKKYLNSV